MGDITVPYYRFLDWGTVPILDSKDKKVGKLSATFISLLGQTDSLYITYPVPPTIDILVPNDIQNYDVMNFIIGNLDELGKTKFRSIWNRFSLVLNDEIKINIRNQIMVTQYSLII